ICSKTCYVKFDSFLDEFQDFISSFRNCHTTREVWNVCAKTVFAVFNNYCVFHVEILFQTGLLENGVKRSWRHIDVWFTGNCHRPLFGRMFKLAMATSCSSQVPPVLFKLADEVANFHLRIIGAFSDEWKPPNGGVNRAARYRAASPDHA